MTHHNTSTSLHSRLGRLTRRFSWPFVVTLLIIATLLFVAGMISLFFDLAPEQRGKLFTLAKLLGGVGTILGTVKTFWKQIREKYSIIHLQRASGHVVICGLGSFGHQLVETFVAKNYMVAVIDANSEHPDIPGCRERGVVVITADAADQAVLNEANVARARYLFAVTGNDNSNIEIARLAHELAAVEYVSGENLQLGCYCHVTSSVASDIFARHSLFEQTHNGFNARLFSLFDVAASYLLEKHPPDSYALRQGATDGPLRLLVIGFGCLGEALVKQAARVGHYLHWREVEITVVDAGAATAEARFLGAFGNGSVPPVFIVPGVTIRFIPRLPESISSLHDLYPQGGLPSIVYLDIDNDSLGVSLAIRWRGILCNEQVPIIVCMTSPLSQLMLRGEFTFAAERHIYAFNPYFFASDYPVMMDEVTDELAKAIHSAYCESLAGNSSSNNPSLVPWRELPEDKKDANRWQADHLAIKLRAIGDNIHDVDALESVNLDANLMTRLAEMEHQRWTAAMLLDGWRLAPGKKDPLRKTHPSLVPFSELPESERAKDDAMIRNIRALVSSENWKRYRQYIDA